MRFRAIALTSAFASLLACGGLLGFGDDEDPPPPPPIDSGAIIDAPVDNYVVTAEATSPDPVCPVFDGGPDSGARSAIATRSTIAKNLDGEFSDYGSQFVVLLDDSAALNEGTLTAKAAAKVEWEPTALWIAFDVTDPMLVGNDTDASYRNDGVEIYVTRNSCRTGCYEKLDHHYIVDHNGFALDYSNANYSREPFDMKSAVVVVAGGYHVEVRVDAMLAFGRELTAGEQIFFDAKLNDGPDQAGFRIWSMHPTEDAGCPCMTCYPYPAFDNRLFSPITLAP